MKKGILMFAVACLIAIAIVSAQHNVKNEQTEHPRIEKAIHELEDAVAYMENAPHNFGGHKVAAIADSKKAIQSLKLCLAFRAEQDNKK